MKIALLLSLGLISLLTPCFGQTPSEMDPDVLIGEWTLDLSPQDLTDANFAIMTITKIKGNSFKGEFYRKGVKIEHAQLNTQLGIIYGALVSRDNSGSYNTSFYLKDGMLHGSTHAIDKKFLAVWTATQNK